MKAALRAGRDLKAPIAALKDFAARPARLHLFITLILSATEGLSLLLLIPLLQLIGVSSGPSATTTTAARLFSVIGLAPTLPMVLVAYVAVVSAQSVLRRQRRILGVKVQQSFALGLRQRVYRAVSMTDWTFLAGQRASNAVHVLTADIDRSGYAASQILDLAAAVMTTAVYVGLAVWFSPLLTIVIVILGALLALLVRRPIERSRVAGQGLSRASSAFYAAMTEHFAGLKLAKGYGVEARHAEIFDAMASQVGNATVATHVEFARMQEAFAIGSAAVLAIVVYVSYSVLRVPTTALLFLLFVFSRLVPRVTGLFEQWQGLVGSLPAFEAVTLFEHQCHEAAQPATATQESITFERRLTFEDVTFAYPTQRERPAIRHLSFSIEAGSTVAIVGASGSGKSTLADLMMGLLTAQSGRILVDGTALGPSTRTAWQAQLGFVPQDTFLFHDSVKANLAWARPDASEAELLEALRLAAADEFVRGLPHALETTVGDRGALISGGERQRLSLARALVRRPRLLILDEATSALDAENEARICQAINQLRQALTIVIISHRMSMVRNADTIHVLDRGSLVESGSWDELVARKDGRFRALCQRQEVVADDATAMLI